MVEVPVLSRQCHSSRDSVSVMVIVPVLLGQRHCDRDSTIVIGTIKFGVVGTMAVLLR